MYAYVPHPYLQITQNDMHMKYTTDGPFPRGPVEIEFSVSISLGGPESRRKSVFLAQSWILTPIIRNCDRRDALDCIQISKPRR